MIEIKYLKNPEGTDQCFELVFPLKEYVPIFSKEERGTELKLYLDLFSSNQIIDGDKKKGTQEIWSTSYECSLDGVPFKMIYDEDYDFVSFYVENEKDRERVSEQIKSLLNSYKREMVKMNDKSQVHGGDK